MTSRLLVDFEDGRVLRAPDEVTVTENFLGSHPFVELLPAADPIHPPTYFVGPDARRRALARSRGEGEALLDAIEYHPVRHIGTQLTLQKVEWQ